MHRISFSSSIQHAIQSSFPIHKTLQLAMRWITDLFFRALSFFCPKTEKAPLSKPVKNIPRSPPSKEMLVLKKAVKSTYSAPSSKVNATGLDKDLCKEVFSYLSGEDLDSLSLVCKDWNRWSHEDRVWRPLIQKEFPHSHEKMIAAPVEERGALKEIYLRSYSLLRSFHEFHKSKFLLSDPNSLFEMHLHPFEAALEKVSDFFWGNMGHMLNQDPKEHLIDTQNLEESVLRVLSDILEPANVTPKQLSMALAQDVQLRKSIHNLVEKYNSTVHQIAFLFDEMRENPFSPTSNWTCAALANLKKQVSFLPLMLKILGYSGALYKELVEKVEKRKLEDTLEISEAENLREYIQFAKQSP